MNLGLRRFYGYFLDILFPLECVQCKVHLKNDDNGPVCSICLDNIPIIQRINGISSTIHLASISFYDDKLLRELIHLFKYESVISIKRTFKILIDKFLSSNDFSHFIDTSNALIVPIPLHPKKFRERGFNQAEVIANLFSSQIKLPIATRLLKRVKNTSPQIKMKSNTERTKNISGSFDLAPDARNILKNGDVILVDDVYTSGATTKEAIKVLREAGAKKILIFVIAKT